MDIRTSLAAGALALSGGAAAAADILETAAGDPRVSTLVAALEASGLAETLAGPGPFTVYAPSDAAFAALPGGLGEILLAPENAERLREVLLYHVDDRLLRADDFPRGATLFKPALEAGRICVTAEDGALTIADGTGDAAAVVTADIRADNGVIHVIDKVLIPGDRPDCACTH